MKVKLKTGEVLEGNQIEVENIQNFNLGKVVFLSQLRADMKQETIMIPYDNILYVSRNLCKPNIVDFLASEE